MRINLDKLLGILVNSSHVAIAVLCQATIFVMHYHFGKDISSNVQNTVNWFYAFLTGHFGASQLWPDKGNDASGNAPQS